MAMILLKSEKLSLPPPHYNLTIVQWSLTINLKVLGASLFFITAHAAFYNYDALEVPEDQEQLVGAIVEEV